MKSHLNANTTRRRALEIFGLVGAASLGGCLGGGDPDGNSTSRSAEEKILGEGPDSHPDAEIATIKEGNSFTYNHQGRVYEFTLENATREQATINGYMVIPDELGQNQEGIDPVSEFERVVPVNRAISIDNYTDLFYGGREEGGYLLAAGRDIDIESDYEDSR